MTRPAPGQRQPGCRLVGAVVDAEEEGRIAGAASSREGRPGDTPDRPSGLLGEPGVQISGSADGGGDSGR